MYLSFNVFFLLGIRPHTKYCHICVSNNKQFVEKGAIQVKNLNLLQVF